MAQTLPASNPAAEAVLSRLDQVRDGGLVVDLACGVGQPSLLLAARRPALSVVGIDLTQAMLDRATELAEANGLGNARFQHGSLDSLPMDDAAADAVISQFGFLQEGDVHLSITEAVRILKPGGVLSVVAFDDMALNTLMSTMEAAFTGIANDELLPDFSYLTALALPGDREDRLRSAGMRTVASELVRWEVPLPDVEVLWSLALAPAPFGRASTSLTQAELSAVEERLVDLSAAFRTPDGGRLVFPMACRAFWGTK